MCMWPHAIAYTNIHTLLIHYQSQTWRLQTHQPALRHRYTYGGWLRTRDARCLTRKHRNGPQRNQNKKPRKYTPNSKLQTIIFIVRYKQLFIICMYFCRHCLTTSLLDLFKLQLTNLSIYLSTSTPLYRCLWISICKCIPTHYLYAL